MKTYTLLRSLVLLIRFHFFHVIRINLLLLHYSVVCIYLFILTFNTIVDIIYETHSLTHTYIDMGKLIYMHVLK